VPLSSSGSHTPPPQPPGVGQHERLAARFTKPATVRVPNAPNEGETLAPRPSALDHAGKQIGAQIDHAADVRPSLDLSG